MLHDAHELADLIQKMERLTEDELIQFIKSMPDGEFIKDSDGKFYKCKYIGMMLNGSIFPLYKSCSLNPLYKDKDGKIHQYLLVEARLYSVLKILKKLFGYIMMNL